jgi:CrcB protein
MLVKILALALAGALGTLCRVGISALFGQWLPRFPWGTIVVNLIGCFLFGLVWALSASHRIQSVELKLYVLGGFMGAFTTYSTYIFDTVQLSQNQGFRAAAAYFVSQNLAAVGALYLGLTIGRIP